MGGSKVNVLPWLNLKFMAIAVVTALSASLPCNARHMTTRGEPPEDTYVKDFVMPDVSPKVSDAYICTAMPLNVSVEEWVIRYQPLASANRAHHMLLFGCSGVGQEKLAKGWWDCGHHGVCEGGRIMYAWAKNAPATALPKDVGFRIGGATGIRFLTLQIHYAKPLPDNIKDHSGVQMEVTTTKQKYKAGIYLLASGYAYIPPHKERVHSDLNCVLGTSGEPTDIHVFAYRVHAHKLGRVITGYLYKSDTGELIEIARGNPQWPQAFYPMDKIYTARTKDAIHARCTWNSTNRDVLTRIGGTSSDEMCNLYLMYYTDREKGSESAGCGRETMRQITEMLPENSDTPLPPNPKLEEMVFGENTNKNKEMGYNNLFEKQPIVLEKKAHSHKKPQPPGYSDFRDYDYGDYDYRERFRQPPIIWDNRQPQYIGDGYRENKYQGIKPNPKPVVYNDYNDQALYSQPGQATVLKTGPVQSQRPNLESDVIQSSREGRILGTSAYQTVHNWGPEDVKLGQVVAVSVDTKGDVVLFHRGSRTWDGSTFEGYKLRDQEHSIPEPTLLHLEKKSGSVLHKWGENFFFMPHGLTLDYSDNMWVTDVGLHQVFKFPSTFGKPLLTLGQRFEHGSGENQFCQPTGIAVQKNGDFFVSDGYCNARIMKFSANGTFISQFGSWSSSFSLPFGKPAQGTFAIPHAVALVEDKSELCVADRENGRVQCFTTSEGKFLRQFLFSEWGKSLFSVAYTPAKGGRLFAVNGPQYYGSQKLEVFEVEYETGKLISSFSPDNQGFSYPHDLAVSDGGVAVYVSEIGPNKIWKFMLRSAVDSSRRKESNVSLSPVSEAVTGKLTGGGSFTSTALETMSSRWSPTGVTTVVLGLLAIPIVVLTTLTIIIRARKRGHLKVRALGNGMLVSSHHSKHENGLNLGSLLNKHHGFEKLATEDLDHDAPDSGDSDVEEFSQVTRA